MTPFWSGWIMFLIVFNLGVTLFLFVWGQRVVIPTQADGTSGHVWAHGVLREGVRTLPLWWVLLSATMFVIGFTYLALFPGFGNSKGYLGWTQHGELAQDTAANAAKLDPLLLRFGQSTVEQLSKDPAATQIGHRLFIDNCGVCHGRDGRGNQRLGAPDLTDDDWLYGGDGKSITTSILDGRHGTMPPFGGNFDQAGLENLAYYVQSLSGTVQWQYQIALGKPQFSVCAACHGPDGKGNQALGAPNLTDKVWLYGGDLASIEETIRNGRSGVMPAWRGRLTENEVNAIAAWIYAQSHREAPAAH
jgi:cytochrome c oxidase cbb3-type subunit 3